MSSRKFISMYATREKWVEKKKETSAENLRGEESQEQNLQENVLNEKNSIQISNDTFYIQG